MATGTAGVEELVRSVFEPPPEVRADPYPTYARLRDEAPMWRSEVRGEWVASRHADVIDVLRGKAWSARPDKSPERAPMLDETSGLVGELFSQVLLFMDPPDHTRLRRLVAPAFSPRAMAGFRGRLEQLVDELLDGLVDRREMDLIADFAVPLPVIAIAELLGVEPEDRPLFRDNIAPLAALLEPEVSAEALQAAMTSAFTLAAYFVEVFEDRRASPRDDLVSALVAAGHGGDRLSPEELLATCILLLGAGHETTMNLLGNGTLALLRNPAQLARLRDEPALAATATEELLRFDSPVQLIARMATEDQVVGGEQVAAGELVVVLLGGANHDPAFVADPEWLDVGRQLGAQVAFGNGIHFCLGAALARMEGEVGFRALITRLPGLELAVDEPVWRGTTTLRGLEALPVRW